MAYDKILLEISISNENNKKDLILSHEIPVKAICNYVLAKDVEWATKYILWFAPINYYIKYVNIKLNANLNLRGNVKIGFFTNT